MLRFRVTCDKISNCKCIKPMYELKYSVQMVNCIELMRVSGEFGVMYLYLRKKLSWDSGDYGLFSTYVSLIGVIGRHKRYVFEESIYSGCY